MLGDESASPTLTADGMFCDLGMQKYLGQLRFEYARIAISFFDECVIAPVEVVCVRSAVFVNRI